MKLTVEQKEKFDKFVSYWDWMQDEGLATDETLTLIEKLEEFLKTLEIQ